MCSGFQVLGLLWTPSPAQRTKLDATNRQEVEELTLAGHEKCSLSLQSDNTLNMPDRCTEKNPLPSQPACYSRCVPALGHRHRVHGLDGVDCVYA